MNIIIATHNNDKFYEFEKMLKPVGISIKSLSEFTEVGEIPETGKTLKENALIKAKTVYQLTGVTALSDDTGLEVVALNGEPGIYSARWAGINCNYEDNINKMIKKIKLINTNKRIAKFRTVMALVGKNREHITEGVIKGVILDKTKGFGGFGYDPVFYIPTKGKTFAEMSVLEKGKISHRGLALKKMIKHLKNYYE